jgi:hypothetical protein
MGSAALRAVLVVLAPLAIAVFVIGLGAVVLSMGVIALLVALPLALAIGALLAYAHWRRRRPGGRIVLRRRS